MPINFFRGNRFRSFCYFAIDVEEKSCFVQMFNTIAPAYDVMFTANTWENSSAHIHSMGVMGKRSALTTSDFVNFAEDFVENPEKKILQVFDAVSKFQSLCVTYGIYKAISDKIQHVLDGLVTDDLNLLQLT